MRSIRRSESAVSVTARTASTWRPSASAGCRSNATGEGTLKSVGRRVQPVESFKDAQGRIGRQAARFHVFAFDDADPGDPGREVTLEDPAIQGIDWTVHLTNKKPVWFEGSQLDGNLMLGRENSYKERGVPVRNAEITDPSERRGKLIIDPGPRTVNRPPSSASPADRACAGYPRSLVLLIRSDDAASARVGARSLKNAEISGIRPQARERPAAPGRGVLLVAICRTQHMATFRVLPGATSTPARRPLSDRRGRAARGCGAAEIVRSRLLPGSSLSRPDRHGPPPAAPP